jgi:hypothetical protein
MHKLLKFFYLLILLSCFRSDFINGKEDDANEKKPSKTGIFALPTSQQPAALFGFGGNIIDKGEVQVNLFSDEFIGKNKCTIDVIPGILYGVRDDFSIYINVPVTPRFRDGEKRSSGFEDFYLQLEYAFYANTTKDFADQATIVASVTTPTGSIRKTPPTGYGSPGFFLGATYYHTTVDWVIFTSHGTLLTTSHNNSKIGDFFLYQFGIARNFKSPEGWIYAGLLEVDGQFQNKNRFSGNRDPNSGGNAIYVTPSLWISSENMIAQFGISFPISQNLYGNQREFDFALNCSLSYSFY